MVIRYFGSKDELFVRASAFDLRLPDLSKVKRAQVGDTLIRHFLELGDGFGGMTVLLKSAASSEYAAARVLELFATQVVPAFERFGNRATAGGRAGLVVSQLLGLALCRYILKVPPVAQMTREEIVRSWTDAPAPRDRHGFDCSLTVRVGTQFPSGRSNLNAARSSRPSESHAHIADCPTTACETLQLDPPYAIVDWP